MTRLGNCNTRTHSVVRIQRTGTSASGFAAIVAIAVAVLDPVVPSRTSSLSAQVAVGSARVKVRGTVFDSLNMQPGAGANVWVVGGSITTKADDNGRFELEDVPMGDQFIAFSTPGLDSVGLGQLGARVNVLDEKARVQLVTPSFRTVWNRMCASETRASTDSGIVWGTIRDASSDQRQSGASAAFSWYEMKMNEKKRYDFGESKHDVRTDSTGTYYACGLPTEIRVAAEAMGSRSASGSVEFIIGERKLTRFDLLVSRDMVMERDSSGNLPAIRAPRGTARLRGRLVDEKGKDVAGATVTFASLDTTVRTNQLGEFTLLNLPSGTHGLLARQIGYAPMATTVDLRADQLSQQTFTMQNPQALAAMNVRAERVAGLDQQDFLRRQKLRSGFSFSGEQLHRRMDIVSALREVPSVTITKTRGEIGVLMSNRKGGQCVPLLYVDKVRTELDQINVYRIEDFNAVEVFTSMFQVPVGVESSACGVILFWTKMNPRW